MRAAVWEAERRWQRRSQPAVPRLRIALSRDPHPRRRSHRHRAQQSPGGRAMTHPADDFEALLRRAYAQFRAASAAGSSTAPFAVVVGGDEACAAFGLVDPPPVFWD